MDFRIKDTGDFLTDSQFRASQPNVSWPPVIDAELASEYGADKVTAVSQPELGPYQFANVTVELVDGVYTQVWAVEYQTIEAIQASLKFAATQKRFEVETGGVQFGGGTVQTGINDQNRITSVIVNARRAGLTTVDFKGAAGWAALPIEQVEAIADAIAVHVQNSFSVERQHHEAIDGITDPVVLSTYDISTGW